MDYEEALLQVTDVLKANNRYRLGDFEQAVTLIREIVTPKGKWLPIGKTVSGINHNFCPICKRDIISEFTNYCPHCGADMRGKEQCRIQ